jgi:hypothetical protein
MPAAPSRKPGSRRAAGGRRLSSAVMPRLLVVHHTPSPTLQAMFEAAVSGSRTDEVEGVEVVIRPALTAAAADVLQADGYLLGTPAAIALGTRLDAARLQSTLADTLRAWSATLRLWPSYRTSASWAGTRSASAGMSPVVNANATRSWSPSRYRSHRPPIAQPRIRS